MGQSPPSSSYNTNGAGLPFYQGNTDFGKIHPVTRIYCSSPLKKAKTNDILVSVRAPVGALNIAKEQCCIGRGIAAIRANDADYLFLYYAIHQFQKVLEKVSSGSTFTAICKQDLISLKIPLPPLPEQQRIATVLATVDEAIAATDEVIAKTEDLKLGLTQDLLTKGIDEEGWERSEETHAFCQNDGMRVPVVWSVVKFSQVCKKALNGGTPSTKIPEYWEGTIPWITGADVVDQRIREVRKYITAEAVENSATHVIPKGMLLLVTRTGVGKVAIAPFDIAISQDLTGIIPTENVSVEYLFWIFNRANEHFFNMNQGTSINGITRNDLMDFALPLPPLPEQRRIAAILSTVDDRLATERNERDRLVALKKGLMQVLLTGRVRVPPGVAGEVAPAHV